MSQSNATCPVCLGELGNTNKTVLECGHEFHYTCVRLWNQQQGSCPLCRQQVRDSPLMRAQEARSPEWPQRRRPSTTSPENLLTLAREVQVYANILENSQAYNLSIICNSCDKKVVSCSNCGHSMCRCVYDLAAVGQSTLENVRQLPGALGRLPEQNSPFADPAVGYKVIQGRQYYLCARCWRIFNLHELVLDFLDDYLDDSAHDDEADDGYPTIFEVPLIQDLFKLHFFNENPELRHLGRGGADAPLLYDYGFSEGKIKRFTTYDKFIRWAQYKLRRQRSSYRVTRGHAAETCDCVDCKMLLKWRCGRCDRGGISYAQAVHCCQDLEAAAAAAAEEPVIDAGSLDSVKAMWSNEHTIEELYHQIARSTSEPERTVLGHILKLQQNSQHVAELLQVISSPSPSPSP